MAEARFLANLIGPGVNSRTGQSNNLASPNTTLHNALLCLVKRGPFSVLSKANVGFRTGRRFSTTFPSSNHY